MADTGAIGHRLLGEPLQLRAGFSDVMTLADVYRFPTQHFGFHQAQLTLTP